MASGIKDKVAILGMGCSKFGERWDMDAEDLIVEAYLECIEDAGIETSQIDAAWFSTAIEEVHVGKSGVPLAKALRLPNIPVTRSRTSVPAAPNRSVARFMPWPPAPPILPSRSASKS